MALARQLISSVFENMWAASTSMSAARPTMSVGIERIDSLPAANVKSADCW
jgi:hypothetical protein